MGGNEVDFETVNTINESWDTIKRIPNHVEIAGELLFRKIFEIAPPALMMFTFGPEFVGNEEELYKSERFKQHAAGVVVMLDTMIHMLGPDLEPATKALTDLGARHVAYGVLPAHYGIVGAALLHTVETALGDKYTPKVKKGWTLIFGFVSTSMCAGANEHLQKTMRQKHSARQGAPDPADDKPGRAISPEVLFKLTGYKPPTKVKKLEEMIDEGFDISADKEDMPDDLTLTSGSGDDEAEVNYMKMVERVYTTWDTIKKIPNYTEVAGVLLFQNIFEIAPQAKGLFPFAILYEDNDEALFKDPRFLMHAKGVVGMLDVAVNMLGPDLEPVTKALEDLGARHCQYDVIAAHYPIVGEALLKTLEAALGDAWTPTVKEGWTGIFGFVSDSMQRGAEEFLMEELDAYHEL